MSQSLQQEWQILQNQFDSYEKYSLLIKLCHVLFSGFTLAFAEPSGFLLTILFLLGLIFWLQDAVWKTFQSRIETRILVLERSIKTEVSTVPFQFNSEFLAERGSAIKLVFEYLTKMLTPTVALPHLCLLLLYLLIAFV